MPTTNNRGTGSLSTGVVKLSVGAVIELITPTGRDRRTVTWTSDSPGNYHSTFRGQGAVPIGDVTWEIVSPIITPEPTPPPTPSRAQTGIVYAVDVGTTRENGKTGLNNFGWARTDLSAPTDFTGSREMAELIDHIRADFRAGRRVALDICG